MSVETDVLDSGPLDFIGVDRANNVIRGIVAAEVGDFKSGRGSFDLSEIESIEKHVNSNNRGHISFVGHPKSGNDVDRPYLGVFKNGRVDRSEPGKEKVRVDLHISDIAMKPRPDSKTDSTWGNHIMDRAEEDPRSLGFSLRPNFKRVARKGKTVWNVLGLRGGDVVLEGDATESFLNADEQGAGTPGLSNFDSPETEDIFMSGLSDETKSFIQDTVKESLEKQLGPALSGALSAHQKKQDDLAAQKAKDDEIAELKKRIEESDLAAERSKTASEFTVKAQSFFKEDELAAIKGKLEKGELSTADAYQQLSEKVIESGGKKMDEGGGNGDLASGDEKKIKEEFAVAKTMGLNMSFEEYQNALSAPEENTLLADMLE